MLMLEEEMKKNVHKEIIKYEYNKLLTILILKIYFEGISHKENLFFNLIYILIIYCPFLYLLKKDK